MCASGVRDTTAFRFSFSRTPAQTEIADARAFYSSLDHVTLEQYPGFGRVRGDPRPGCLFLARRDQTVVCYAWVTERRSRGFGVAEIEFGPLFDDPLTATVAINALHDHYLQRGFALLSISLGQPAGPVTDALARALRDGRAVHHASDDPNWSSVRVDLSDDADTLLRHMSKGHRSGIRKAFREGVRVRQAQGTDDIDGFAAVLLKMHHARNQPVDAGETVRLLHDTLALLTDTDMGELLVVENGDDRLIGGVIIVDQGVTARYYKGAADPDVRHLAVLHPALFLAMQRAQQRGRAFFDLWGYNLQVDASDPRHNINRFKKGFGGEIISYPATMNLPLGARGLVYTGLLGMKNWIGRR